MELRKVRGPTKLLVLTMTIALLLLAGTAMAASVMHNQPVSAILLSVACFAMPVFYIVRSGLRRRSAPWAARRSWAKTLLDKLSWDDRKDPTSMKTKVEASWARHRVYCYPTEKIYMRPALCSNTT